MSLLYWQSLKTLEALHKIIQDAVTDWVNHCYNLQVWVGSDSEAAWISAIKIHETAASTILQIQLPHNPLQDLEIEISPETAILRGKLAKSEEVEGFFSPGWVQHIIPLPIPVHPEAVQAEIIHNTLVLTLPKSSQVRRRHIALKLTELPCPAPVAKLAQPKSAAETPQKHS